MCLVGKFQETRFLKNIGDKGSSRHLISRRKGNLAPTRIFRVVSKLEEEGEGGTKTQPWVFVVSWGMVV